MSNNTVVCPWCFGTFTQGPEAHNQTECKIANIPALVAERYFLFTGKWPEDYTRNKEITNATDK